MRMDPVGLSLALIPLLISAVELYGECREPLQRFLHFSTELSRFQHDLAIENQRFRNQCSILLLSAVDWKQGTSNSDHGRDANLQSLIAVETMLCNMGSPLWSNKDLEHRVQQQLGSSAKLISVLIDEMNSILRELKTESLEFGRAISHAAKPDSVLEKLQIKARWKAGFAHSHLNKLKRLERANDKFRELHEQSVEVIDEVRRHKSIKSDIPRPSALEKYRRIQRASYEVYQALAKSCCEHPEHLTRLCLEVKFDGSIEDGPVIFRLAFGKHAFLSVEMALDINVAGEQIVIEVQDMLSRAVEQLFNEQEIASQSAHINVQQSLASRPSSGADSGGKGRVYTLSDLCAQIGPCSRMGPPSPPTPSETPERSLHNLLDGLAAQAPAGRLSHCAQFHLARLVTTAVLQYYRTPWLRAWWRSSDILFANADAAAIAGHDPAKARLAEPHIAVRVRDLLIAPPSRTSTFPLQGVARNPVLYGLGILLIEVACSAPISTLLTPGDSKQGCALAEWIAAQRLTRNVCENMGPAYARIVRRCLYCDFGCVDADLSNAELQAAFYTSVVCEFEKVAAELQKLFP